MASKQTRRSISVSGTLYERLKAYCLTNDVGMSTIVEELLRKHFEMEPRTTAPRAPSSTPRKTTSEVRLTSNELSEKTDWKPSIQLPARVDKIKEVAEAKKVLTPDEEKASKIFTF